MTLRIPIRNRAREIVAETIIDDQDESLATFAWCLNRPGGYAVRTIQTVNGPRLHGLARQIMGLEYGDRLQVDHVDRDKMNNTRLNLRVCTVLAQQQNKSPYTGARSRFRGVYWHRKVNKRTGETSGHWEAKAVLEGRAHYLGRYHDEIQAALAAHRFRSQYMPWATVDPALLEVLGPRLV